MTYADVVRSMNPKVYLPLGDLGTSGRNLGVQGAGPAQGEAIRSGPPAQGGALVVGGPASSVWPVGGSGTNKVAAVDDGSFSESPSFSYATCAWIRRLATGSLEVVLCRDDVGAPQRQWQLRFSSDQMQLSTQLGGGAVNTTETFTDTTRPHLFGVSVDGLAVTFIYDGRVVSTHTLASAGAGSGSCDFYAGNHGNDGFPLIGEMSHAVYWTRAVSVGEFQRLHRAGRHGSFV